LKTAANTESIAAFYTHHKEVSQMSKSQDAKKDKKKQPKSARRRNRQRRKA
jgi:hypothetical protein